MKTLQESPRVTLWGSSVDYWQELREETHLDKDEVTELVKFFTFLVVSGVIVVSGAYIVPICQFISGAVEFVLEVFFTLFPGV